MANIYCTEFKVQSRKGFSQFFAKLDGCTVIGLQRDGAGKLNGQAITFLAEDWQLFMDVVVELEEELEQRGLIEKETE